MDISKMSATNQSKTIDVVTLGRAAIDLNANEINRPIEETMSFTKSVGGSPANIAVACVRLGLKTAFIGRVSDDQNGRYVRNYFTEVGILTDSLITDEPGSSTGITFTEIKGPGDAGIIMYRCNAADLNLRPSDVSEELLKKSRTLIVSGTALAKSPSREAVFTAIDFAKRHDTIVVFDLDYRPYTWNSLEETSIYYKLVADKSDIILGTREEFDVLEYSFSESERKDEKTAQRWLAENASIIVIKHGKEGSLIYLKNGEVVRGAVFPVTPLKTMGAGDSFAGGFLYGLLKGKSIYEATRIGAAAAAIVVMENSCSEAMPTLEEIEAFIASYEK